jgi:hypothetical protein
MTITQGGKDLAAKGAKNAEISWLLLWGRFSSFSFASFAFFAVKRTPPEQSLVMD